MTSLTSQLARNMATVFCAPPDVEGFTPTQIAALHAFKYEVLASLNRLYMVVPEQIANPLVDKYMPQPGGGG